jgi:hypothetical protein
VAWQEPTHAAWQGKRAMLSSGLTNGRPALDSSIIRRIALGAVFGAGTWMLAEMISPAIALGVAAGLLAFYVTAVETRVRRLERPR